MGPIIAKEVSEITWNTGVSAVEAVECIEV